MLELPIGNSGGEGGSKAITLKGKYEVKLEFQEGYGDSNQKTLHGVNGYFLEHYNVIPQLYSLDQQ